MSAIVGMPSLRVHIFGASGSGTTTLGHALAAALDVPHVDTDDVYWLRTADPFTVPRPIPARLEMLVAAFTASAGWISTGSLCGWGDSLVPRFTHAVFTSLDDRERMRRIVARERLRYGAAIDADGDRHVAHQAFLAWAALYETAAPPVRSRRMHEQWGAALPCPLLTVDTLRPVPALVDELLAQLVPDVQPRAETPAR